MSYDDDKAKPLEMFCLISAVVVIDILIIYGAIQLVRWLL